LARAREPQGGVAIEIASVVLLNGAPFPEVHRPKRIQRLLLSPIGGLVVRIGGQRQFKKAFSSLFGPQTRPGMIELHDYWTLLCLHDGVRVMRSLLRYVHERQFQRQRWAAALTAGGVPMRLICGAADPVSGLPMAARYR